MTVRENENRGETMKDNKGRRTKTRRKPHPPPPNLTKQDGSRAVAATTGCASWDTIIGFHYAAISLK